MSAKTLSVSYLIRKFNILNNTERQHTYMGFCNCLFRMCNNVHGVTNVNNACPLHPDESSRFASLFLQRFIHKNIIYISVNFCEKILYDKQLHIMLPLVVHLHTNKEGVCHIFDKKTSLKLNNVCVKFTNLLIVNMILCNRRSCNNFNNALVKYKTIKFKYAIFINCLKKPNKYMYKLTNKLQFALQLEEFLRDVNTDIPGP